MRKSFFRLKLGVLIGLLAIFFIIINLFNFTKEIKNFFYLISSPIEKSLWQTGENISHSFSEIFTAKDLKKEIEILQSKNQELISQLASLKEAKKENEVLRQALNIGLEKDFQLIFSQTVSKDAFQDSILIDKGLKDGISEGLPVITSQKFLVGRVGKVYTNFAEVTLITNKNSSFDAVVLANIPDSSSESLNKEDAQIYGVVKGKGDLNLYLDFVSKEKKLSKDDLVVTAALGGIFPSGLAVGQIKEIINSDVEPFQAAEIIPGFNLQNLNQLFVIADFINR